MSTTIFRKGELFVLLALLLFTWGSIAQTTGDYRSNATTGNWTSITTWQTFNGTTWVAATTYPGQTTGSYNTSITTGNNITLNTTLLNAFPSLTINGTLTLSTNGATYTVNVSSITVNSGGTIYFNGKGTLSLPVNAIISVESGGLSGSCSNNQEIIIGSVHFAYCTGGGSTGYSFSELMNLGGTINATPSSNSPVCFGGTINLSGAVSGAVSTNNLTYSWKVTSPTGGITTTNTQNTSISNAITGIYTCTLTCTTIYNGVTYTNAETIYVTVNPSTIISVQPTPTQSICLAKTPTPLTVSAIGIALTYQWYSNSSNATAGGVIISGATTSSYVPSTTTSGTKYYYCIVSGTCGTVTSSTTAFTVGGTSTWNGTTWDSTPSIITTLYINGNYSTTENIQGCSCSILSGNVTINSGHTMTLENELNTTNGSFTINNNANLIQINATSNIGNISIKRNTNALMRLDYTLWSSPVMAQNMLAFSPNTLTNRFYRYDTPTDSYASLTPATTNFATATGYLIRTPNNFPTTPTIWPGTFTGIPNNGTINYTLNTTGAKYNAVGNPYPSPINLLQFVSDNAANITGTLYFWRETNNNTLNIAYATWAGGTFITNANNDQGSIGSGGTNPNNVINQGQGFIVQGSATGTQVVFNNNQRIDNHADHFFKTDANTTTNEEFNRIWLNLTSTTGAFYQMAFGYNSNATNEIDFNDGKSLGSGPIALNTYLNNTDLAIQGKALPFNENDVIPLSYKVTDAGNYTITLDHKDGLFTNSNQAIYIKDNLDQTYNQINDTNYTFTSDTGSYTDRFQLVFQNSSLTNNQNTFTQNSIITYKNNENIVVNTGKKTMKSIKVFDIRGRLLLQKENIYAGEIKFNIDNTNQVIFIKVTATDNTEITKKVVN